MGKREPQTRSARVWQENFARLCTGLSREAFARRCGIQKHLVHKIASGTALYLDDRDALAIDRAIGAYPGWTSLLWELAFNESTTQRVMDAHWANQQTHVIESVLSSSCIGLIWLPLVTTPQEALEPTRETRLEVKLGTITVGMTGESVVKILGAPEHACMGPWTMKYSSRFYMRPGTRTIEWAWQRPGHVVVVYLEDNAVVAIGEL